MLDGRLPSKVRCGTSHAGVPSARTSCWSFAKGQRLCLGKHVGHEQVVVAAERVKRLNKRDEVAGDELGPLMNQLVEGMLAIGTRLPPVDWPGLATNLSPVKRDMLAVALHRQLLEVSRKAF